MGPQRRESGTGERGPGQPEEQRGHPGTRDALHAEGPGLAWGRPWECHAAESRCRHGAVVEGTGFRKLGDSVSRVDGSTLPQ